MPYVPVEEEKKYYELLIGHQPTNLEMNRWPEEKFLSLIDFLKSFHKEDQKTWNVNKTTWPVIRNKYLNDSENVYWREFVTRIYAEKSLEAYPKIKAMAKVLGLYFRRNPATVSENIRKACVGFPNLQWGLETFSEEQTKSGLPIVTQNPDSGLLNETKKSPQLLYEIAIHRSLDLFQQLLNSISTHEIKKMKTKEKFDAVSKMAFVLNTAKNNKTKSQVFIGLNVGKESVRSLEEKLLEYNDEQQRLSEN